MTGADAPPPAEGLSGLRLDADGLEAERNAPGGSTAADVKTLAQELLRYGYIEEQRKPGLFRRAVTQRDAIESVLEPLDLTLRLDEHRGLAFLRVSSSAYAVDDEGKVWSHPLVRRQRLTLEQSLLIAILRQVFIMHEQEAGIGSTPPRIAVEDLLPQFVTYFADSGSDAKNESRLLTLLDQLKTYGIVAEVDNNGDVLIRPLIAHLANPESLAALLQALEDQVSGGDGNTGANDE